MSEKAIGAGIKFAKVFFTKVFSHQNFLLYGTCGWLWTNNLWYHDIFCKGYTANWMLFMKVNKNYKHDWLCNCFFLALFDAIPYEDIQHLYFRFFLGFFSIKSNVLKLDKSQKAYRHVLDGFSLPWFPYMYTWACMHASWPRCNLSCIQ